MKKERSNTVIVTVVSIVVLVLIILGIILMVSASNKKKQQATTPDISSVTVVEDEIAKPEPYSKPEHTSEDTADTLDEPVEVVEDEDPTTKLSNEEWIESLNLQFPTFMVLNNKTGKKRTLKFQEQYTLQDGDELAISSQPDLSYYGDNNSDLYESKEFMYDSYLFKLKYDKIKENTEFTVVFVNDEGEMKGSTVYLSVGNIEIVESTEETVEDVDISSFSDDEWVQYLVENSLKKLTFLVFNKNTGERKVLEDGQQYTLQDGDELAINWPNGDWGVSLGFTPGEFYEFDRNDYYYSGVLNMDNCRANLTEGEFTEIVISQNDPDGVKQYTTLYLSK
ncbi:MAG: hypothetical protein IJ833_03215 [Lachnospiraceae bacterium]|nr:hypothetical protein [Lachnospiraceae bacterium]